MPSHPQSEMRIGPAFAILAALCLLPAPGSAQSTWELKDSGVVGSLSGVAFGNGQFVVVGQSGTILTSPDATTWTPRVSGTISNLRGITFGNGLFLAVGSGGIALSSPDGVTWTSQTTRTGSFLSGATFADGRFVAVGGSGAIRFSDNGQSWDFGLMMPSESEFLDSVTFGGSRFVAVGEAGRIVSSADGQIWRVEPSTTSAYLTGITHFDGLFLATGDAGTILSSNDGVAWSPQSSGTDEWLRAVVAGSQHLVAVGASGAVLLSSNGTDWEPASSGLSTTLNGVAHGGGYFVAVGDPSGVPSRGVILVSAEELSGISFFAWRELEFTPTELADPAVSGPSADPNHNGLKNFLEYAFGLPPKVLAGREHLPKLTLTRMEGGAVQTEITFRRPADRVGQVTYSLQHSPDLIEWLDLDVPEEIVTESNGIQEVRMIDTAPGATRTFYRVGVTGS